MLECQARLQAWWDTDGKQMPWGPGPSLRQATAFSFSEIQQGLASPSMAAVISKDYLSHPITLG